MKTYKHLYKKIISFENIYQAYMKASVGKHNKPYVILFTYELENNLLQLQHQLKNKTYQPGDYKSFYIYTPKHRKISAAPFRDRVAHHALINIIGPLIEKTFIHDSYANRIGKGTHAAIKRYQQYCREFPYVLKCDIKRFFPSIDHEVLKAVVRTKIADQDVLWLIDKIIDGSNPQEPVFDLFPGDDLLTPITRQKGLPLGNLTSQFFANWMLNPLDHFVKQELQCKAYIRYVDDFVLFTSNKEQLWQWLQVIEEYLDNHRLKLNDKRTAVYPSASGRAFLGQLVYPHLCRLRGENVRRFRKRRKSWQGLSEADIELKISGWLGHAMQADSRGLIDNELRALRELAPALKIR